MGKFPSFDENVRINMGSPIQAESPENARKYGESTAAFGEALMKVGNAVATAEAEDLGNQASEAFYAAKQEADKEDLSKWQSYDEVFQSKFSEKMSKISGDPIAMFKAQKTFDKLQSNVAIVGGEEKLKRGIKHLDNTSELNRNANAGNIINDPTLAEDYFLKARESHRVNAEAFGAEVADSIFAKDVGVYANSYIESKFMRSKNDPSALLSLKKELGAMENEANVYMSPDELMSFGLQADESMKLNYKNRDSGDVAPLKSELLRRLDPATRLKMMNDIDRQIGSAAKSSAKYLERITKQLESEVETGEPLSTASLAEWKSAFDGSPQELKGHYAQRMEMLMGAENIINDVLQGNTLAAQAKIKNMAPTGEEPVLEREAKAKKVEYYTKMLENIEAKKLSDSGGFYYQQNKEDAKAMASIEAVANPTERYAKIDAVANNMRDAGFPVRILSNAEAVSKAKTLAAAAAAGPDEVDQVVAQLESVYGPHVNSIMYQIAETKKDGVPENIALIGFANSPESRQMIIAASDKKNLDLIDKKFQASRGSEAADFKLAVEETQRDMAKKYFGEDTDLLSNPIVAAIDRQIEYEAKVGMLAGKPITKALADAETSVIEKNFATFQSGNSTVLLPRKNINEKTAMAFLQNNDPAKYSKFTASSPDVAELRTKIAEVGQQLNSALNVLKDPKLPIPQKTYVSTEVSMLRNKLIGLQREEQTFFKPNRAEPWDIRNTNAWQGAATTPAKMKQFGNSVKIRATADFSGVELVGVDGRPVMGKNNKPMVLSIDQLNHYNKSNADFYMKKTEPAKPKATEAAANTSESKYVNMIDGNMSLKNASDWKLVETGSMGEKTYQAPDGQEIELQPGEDLEDYMFEE